MMENVWVRLKRRIKSYLVRKGAFDRHCDSDRLQSHARVIILLRRFSPLDLAVLCIIVVLVCFNSVFIILLPGYRRRASYLPHDYDPGAMDPSLAPDLFSVQTYG